MKLKDYEDGQIIGYINTSDCCPMPGTIIYKNSGDLCIRYPSLKTLIVNKHIDEVENHIIHRGKFEKEKRMIKEDEYAYFVSNEVIIVGNHKEIREELKEILMNGDLSENDNRMIWDFLLREK